MNNRKKKINKLDLKYKLKLFTNKTWKKVLLTIASLILLNTFIFLVTGKNLIERSIRTILYQVGIYTEEIKQVNIDSTTWWNNEEGSWQLTKSADWIDLNKAELTINLNTNIKTSEKNKDVIFVFDISGSMSGDKIERVKQDSKELTEYILSDPNNNIALITFDTTSTTLTNLTNDYDFLINSIDNLQTGGTTNYSAGLKNVDNILRSYRYNQNRELVVLFLTDGYPNEDTPDQISQYKYLKERYPYILIEGIQYEMGDQIINEIIEISDAQFLAHTENLNNVLFDAALSPENYEVLEITDFIDNEYFHIESEQDINTDTGFFELQMENGNQKVIWNLGENSFRTGSQAKLTITLTLNEKYNYNRGLYPTNTKEIIKSKLSNIDEETINSTKTPVLQNGYKITYDTNEPKGCRLKSISEETHYAFEIVNKKTEELSCPNYVFKGWEIEEQVTTINDDTFIMPPQDITIRGVWTSQDISKSMEGTIHEKATLWRRVKNDAENGLNGAKILSSTINDDYKVYYYNSNTNNHVYFAGKCWQILRTTDTGGVKILYEGSPTNGTTCKNLDITSTPKSAYSTTSNTLADVGYMYNKSYNVSSSYIQYSAYKITYMYTASNYKYFGDTYTYSNGQYTVENKDGSPVERQIWSENYQNLTGYYSCFGKEGTNCTTLSFITGADKNYAYTLELENGETTEDVNTDIKIGTSYTKNADGTYTLNNVTTIKKSDWYSEYQKHNNKYICEDYSQTTCQNLKSIVETSSRTNIITEDVNNNPETDILYGNSFTYDGTNYHLVDTIKSNIWSDSYNKLDNNHYTCLNKSGTCDKIYYLVYTTVNYKYYYELSDGKGINDIVNEMLYADDVNKYDSAAKETLDKWYEDNLITYTDFIEDTVYCNNRSILNLNALNSNGGSLSNSYVIFENNRYTSLTCSNLTDKFTVSSDIGNGALKYPIGLLTQNEAQLVGKNIASNISSNWLLSPYRFYLSSPSVSMFYRYNGNISYNSGYASQYIVPLISLKNNVGYIKGNGSIENPYVIED